MDPATERSSDGPLRVGGRALSVGGRGGDFSGQVNPTHSNNQDSRLLNLPTELRLEIWEISCTWPNKPSVRWAADSSDAIESSFEDVDGRWVVTCKQVYEEALPILLANILLHITYQGHSPNQPIILPRRSLCQRIEFIFFHCTDGRSLFDKDKPPKQSVPFRRYPSLKSFTVCKPILVAISRLTAADGSSLVSPEEYIVLTDEEKLAVWKTTGLLSANAIIDIVARFGRGGWLSRIVGPENNAGAYDIEDTDSDDEGDESKAMYYDTYSGVMEDVNLEKREGSEAEDLKVINKMRTILEAELVLYWGEDSEPISVQTMLVTLDVKTRHILEIRLLSGEEEEQRRQEAAEAT